MMEDELVKEYNAWKNEKLRDVDARVSEARKEFSAADKALTKAFCAYDVDRHSKEKENAWILAQDLQRFGFNTDFAPVADVWTVKGNAAIGDRAYSDDYDGAAELIASAVRGFRDGGTLCCLKHFPGHGSTTTDSHEEAAVVQKDLDTLKKEDLKLQKIYL